MRQKGLLIGFILFLSLIILTGCEKVKSEEEYLKLSLDATTSKSFAEAIKSLEKLIKHYPQSANSELYRVKLLDNLIDASFAKDNKTGEYLARASQITGELKSDTSRVWYIYRLPDYYNSVNDAAKAEEVLSILDAKLTVLLAQRLLSERLPQKGIEFFLRVKEKFPEYPDMDKVCFLIGFTYSEELKDYPKASIFFKELLEKYPDSDLSDDAEWMLEKHG
jgi:outer membrane protein assembly factor BamD (BamD/ComL family)